MDFDTGRCVGVDERLPVWEWAREELFVRTGGGISVCGLKLCVDDRLV